MYEDYDDEEDVYEDDEFEDEETDLNDQEEASHVQHPQCERPRNAHWTRLVNIAMIVMGS